MKQRTFLFLQGLASPFFFRLGQRLRAEGHRVIRVNVCGLDWVTWPGRALNFRGPAQDWPAFIEQVFRAHKVTDVVAFGDCRPYHKVALDFARSNDLRLHVFEEGYVRPHWVTLEDQGTNGHSAIPRNPAVIRDLAARMSRPPPIEPIKGSFFNRALWDVAANIVGTLLWPAFRHYKRHWTEHPFLEYYGWLGRFARTPFERRRDARVIAEVLNKQPYYFVPLQLHSDYQIRAHSPFTHPRDAVDVIMRSFANHADAGKWLLFKLHPLDNGLFDYRRHIMNAAHHHGVSGRVRFVTDGPLDELVRASQGLVLVNSSVGMLALEHGRPVKTLGIATYDMPGLTFQGALDEFWTSAQAPDPAFFALFRRVTLNLTQINGGFFTARGVALAVQSACNRMLSGQFAMRTDREPERQAIVTREPAVNVAAVGR